MLSGSKYIIYIQFWWCHFHLIPMEHLLKWDKVEINAFVEVQDYLECTDIWN